MTSDTYTTLRVRKETKSKLNTIKGNKESYNDLCIRLMEDNEKLNNILLNIELLQEYFKAKE